MGKNNNGTDTNEKRRVGKQKTSWEDEIIKFAGTAWGRDVGVRDRWRKVGKAYAERWAH